MNFHHLLKQRAADKRPVRVGVIGAGKFSSMFLAQARSTPGLHVMAICDLDLNRARSSAVRIRRAMEKEFGCTSVSE